MCREARRGVTKTYNRPKMLDNSVAVYISAGLFSLFVLLWFVAVCVCKGPCRSFNNPVNSPLEAHLDPATREAALSHKYDTYWRFIAPNLASVSGGQRAHFVQSREYRHPETRKESGNPLHEAPCYKNSEQRSPEGQDGSNSLQTPRSEQQNPLANDLHEGSSEQRYPEIHEGLNSALILKTDC